MKGANSMAMYTEPSKKGILSLIVMMLLIILVVALSEPIYRALSGGGGTAYTSVQQGYGGEVTVTLTVKDGKVDRLSAQGTSETPGLGGKAITQFNETAFADLSGTPIGEVQTQLDAVSGATVTSGAVAAGFREVLEQAQQADSQQTE